MEKHEDMSHQGGSKAEAEPLLGIVSDENPVKDQYEEQVMNLRSVIGRFGPGWLALYDKLNQYDLFKKDIAVRNAELVAKTDLR